MWGNSLLSQIQAFKRSTLVEMERITGTNQLFSDQEICRNQRRHRGQREQRVSPPRRDVPLVHAAHPLRSLQPRHRRRRRQSESSSPFRMISSWSPFNVANRLFDPISFHCLIASCFNIGIAQWALPSISNMKSNLTCSCY